MLLCPATTSNSVSFTLPTWLFVEALRAATRLRVINAEDGEVGGEAAVAVVLS